MARQGHRPVRTVRASAPRQPRYPAPPPAAPSGSLTGKAVAVMLVALFVALVLVGATKGFGALGHPLLGLLIGIAVLVLSALLYWRQAHLAGDDRHRADDKA